MIDTTPPAFDWKHPDYTQVYAQRAERLRWLRANPDSLQALKAHYAEHVAEFIGDWALTSDPRNRNRGIPVEVPFILFPKQREMLDYVADRMRSREPGLIEKSRDCGASWLVVCLAATTALFNANVVIGLGSRTEDRVDRSGDPDSLFWKIRFFLKNLPPEFRGGWDETKHSAHMRIQFPSSGSAIVGEAGDGIGRGGRSTAYFVDEAAFIERPQLIEASLASNTECRIDVSTPNGRANSFAIKRHSGRVKVFTFRWRDDPRKDQAWYDRQCEILDPVTRGQEIDLSYDASVEGILIPSEWVHAAIDAHTKLGVAVTGERRGALDVADEGKDKCAFAGRHGVVLDYLESWSGKNSDIYRTVVRTLGIADMRTYPGFDYDGDGLGAGVRGDAVDINAKRRAAGKPEIEAVAFRGSGAVSDPDGSMVEGRVNKDYFANAKAQSWWALRLRFQATYRAVVEGMAYAEDGIISIAADLPELNGLISELSQPTYSINGAGKVVVDKTPEGALSPNLADAVMIAFAPLRASAYFRAPAVGNVGAGIHGHAMPKRMDFVFAVISVIEDAAGVVFIACNTRDGDGTRGPRFYVLDWDIRTLDGDTETWAWSVAQRLTDLCMAVNARIPAASAVFVDDFAQGYAELLRQRGFPATAVGEDLPPVAERFNKARPYVTTGLVLFTEHALARVASFHGATRNFLREIIAQPQVSPGNPLALAFATSVLLGYRGSAGVPAPTEKPAENWSPHDWSGGKPGEGPPWRGFRVW